MRSLINNFLDMPLRDILMACANLTEEEMCIVVDNFLNISDALNASKDKDRCLCRTEAYQYLRISRSSFDAKVKDGTLPKGHKIPGRGPIWYKKDLDNYLKTRERKSKIQLV